MQCGDVTRAQQNTSRSWWPAGFQTPMMWSGSPSEWSGGACDACRPPSLLLFPVPLRARDALNVLRNTHKVSTMVIKDKDWATLKLQSRDRESETKWESHLIYDLMTSWPHDLITSWTCEPHDLWTCEPMTMWPCDLLVSVSSAVWVVRHNNTQDLIKDLRGKWDFRFWWSIFSDLFLFTQFHMWHFFFSWISTWFRFLVSHPGREILFFSQMERLFWQTLKLSILIIKIRSWVCDFSLNYFSLHLDYFLHVRHDTSSLALAWS